MHVALTEDQAAFQRECRTYFEGVLTPEVLRKISDPVSGGTELRRVLRQMGSDGWLGAGWPVEYGGRGFTPIEKFICFDESMRAGAPVNTLNTLGPALMKFGSDEQRKFFLPRLLTGEMVMCIGYSEPGAGTDLASLKTRAVRDGDEYVINGQKLWTSVGQMADYVWLAARTDPNVPKHKGISLFLIPMKTPGISVVPLRIMGESDINQVFYEDVRVPVSARLGAENEGWNIITSQLNDERIILCSSGVVERILLEVRRWAQDTCLADGRRVIDQEWVQLNLARVHAQVEFVRLLNWKIAFSATYSELNVADASATKIFGSELYVESFRLLMEVVGEHAYLMADAPGAVLEAQLEDFYREHVILTFAGGTNEVLRDMIATTGLGMPRAQR